VHGPGRRRRGGRGPRHRRALRCRRVVPGGNGMTVEAPAGAAAVRPPGALARSLTPSGDRVRHPGDLGRLLLSGSVLVLVILGGLLVGDRVLGDQAAMVRAVDARSTPGHALIIGVQILTTLGAAVLAIALLWQRRYRVI